MNYLMCFVFPLFAAAQFGHRQGRVYLHVNRDVPNEAQASQGLVSDSFRSQAYVDGRGQIEVYPYGESNERNQNYNHGNTKSENVQNKNPERRLRTNLRENSQGNRNSEIINSYSGKEVTNTRNIEPTVLTNLHRNLDNTNRENIEVYRPEPNERNTRVKTNSRDNTDTRNVENIDVSNSGTSYSKQGSTSRNQPTRRTIDDKNPHEIVFIDTEYTTKSGKNRGKTTAGNEIYSSPPVKDRRTEGWTEATGDQRLTEGEKWAEATGDRRHTESWEEGTTGRSTASTPSVDDRAAFLGDKCPTGKVKFNGICVVPDR